MVDCVAWGSQCQKRMTSAPHRQYTIAEYVQLERHANVRHEFVDGQIYAMAGGSPEHGARSANLIALFHAHLRGQPCRVHTSDVRVRIQATGLDTYPDVSVVCGRAEHDRDDPDAIVNPILLAEVLSSSTEAYDRGEKLEHFKKIATLAEVVFVAHDRACVEVVQRGKDGSWTVQEAGAGGTVRLESIHFDLPVDEVYRDALAS